MKTVFSVIVVNWEGENIIRECLNSIICQEYANLEIIVVDNGSSDNSINILEAEYHANITLVKLDKNYGFAKANNIGLSYCKGDYVFLLNNDAVLQGSFFHHINEVILAGPSSKIGMIVPTILNYYNRHIIDSIGLSIYLDGVGRGRYRGRDINSVDVSATQVMCPSGCAGIYNMDMVKVIGLFDETFYMYCEDLDLGLRARLSGWDCVFCKNAVVHHKYSYSAGMYSTRKLYYVERNRIYVLLKNFPAIIAVLSIFFTAFRYLYQFITMHKNKINIKTSKSHNENLFRVLLKAYYDAFKNMGRMVNERRKNKKFQKMSLWQFLSMIITFHTRPAELAITES
jgi:GT2 family glycosyltransferase